MTEKFTTRTNNTGTLDVTATNVQGLRPTSAIYNIDNATIERFVEWTFSEVNVEVSAALVDLNSRNPRAGKQDINISLVVYFKKDSFVPRGGNSLGAINPLVADMMSDNITFEPSPEISRVLESCILLVNNKPDKFINQQATPSSPAQIAVRLDVHRVLRMMLAAPVNEYVITIVTAASREDSQVILSVAKAIATVQGNTKRMDTLHQRALDTYGSGGGGRNFRNNSNNRNPIR